MRQAASGLQLIGCWISPEGPEVVGWNLEGALLSVRTVHTYVALTDSYLLFKVF